MGLVSVLCRVILATSTAFFTRNQITLELSTGVVAPSSLLFCFNNTEVQLTSSNFWLNGLKEGGGILDYSEQTLVRQGEYFWASTNFFSSSPESSHTLEAAEYSTVRGVLGTDGTYARTFSFQRYDWLTTDSSDQHITGILDFPSLLNQTANTEETSNCVLLTGSWKASTRYEVIFEIQNPAAPDTSNTTAGSGAQETMFPIPWLVPITTQVVTTTALDGTVLTDFNFTVRGDKKGTACILRPATVPVLETMWDACEAAKSLNLLASQNSTPTALSCLNSLRQATLSIPNPLPSLSNLTLAQLAFLTSTFPYNRPPLLQLTTSSFGQANCPEIRSSRWGGDCIDCGLGRLSARNTTSPLTCTCLSNQATQLVGPTLCGPLIVPDGSVSSSATNDIADRLCEIYTVQQTQWRMRLLPAKVVARQFIRAFTRSAAALMDAASIAAANETFASTLIWDNRYPNSPTRTTGIKPVCNTCDGKTTFINTFNKNVTAVYDYQFEAMNVFRLIGYLLDQVAGVPCTALWDRFNPRELKYGPYEKKLCQPLAPPQP